VKTVAALKAFHGSEVPFVFSQTLELDATRGEAALSEAMVQYWVGYVTLCLSCPPPATAFAIYESTSFCLTVRKWAGVLS
jgi:hypothetical protein